MPTPVLDIEAICGQVADAGPRLLTALAGLDPGTVADEIAFLTSGDYGELTANLRYKVLEGLLAPLPPVWDLLHFAHGPFQQAFERRAVFVALARQGAAREAELLAQLAKMLVPGRHTLVKLESQLRGPLAIFEHEALLNHLMCVLRDRATDHCADRFMS